MDYTTIFVLTLKGEGEIKNHTHHLSGDIKRALTLVDDESTVEKLMKRAAPSLRTGLSDMLQELANGGFIQDKNKPSDMPRMATPKMSIPARKVGEEGEDLDFTTTADMHVPTPETLAAEAAKAKAQAEAEAKAHAEAEARVKQAAEAARLRAEQEAAKARAEAEAARIKAEQEAAAAKAQLEAAKARAEAEAKAHAETEARAKQAVEAARLRAEQEAAKVRAEAEAARIKAEREAAAAKAQLEAVKARAEAEAKARAEAEARAKQAAEAARLRAEQEAARVRAEVEAVRIKAEQDAAAAKAQLEAAKARAEAEARTRAEAEARAKQTAEAARLKAEQEAAKARAEAEAVRIKAEQEAAAAKAQLEAAKARAEAEAKARAEAEAKAQQEAEAARLRVEQEAAKAKADAEAARLEAERVRAEAEAFRIKAEREAAEAEARLKQEVEAARIKAEQDAAKAKAEARARQEAEDARRRAEEEAARAKVEAEEKARQAAAAKALSEAVAAAKAKLDIASARSTIATVLFFDVVGYTKQSVSRQIELKGQFNKLVSEFIKDIDENQRIILDTGDGAAIGFLQHPEDAIEVAMQFRHAVIANHHQDYPELKVRIGIHLGPVNVVKDMNGQNNMVGDGINDAQRIMSFASTDSIYISRSYFDVVSRLTTEYANLFKYRGVEKDKHGREHQVYEVMDEQAEVVEQLVEKPVQQQEHSPFEINLESFALNGLDESIAAPGGVAPEAAPAKAVPQAEKAAQKTSEEIEAEAKAAAQLKAQQEAEAARIHAEQEAAKAKAEEDARVKAEAEREMGEEQAKVWSEAEQRAKAEAQAKAERATQQAAQARAVPRVAKTRGKPLPWGKIAAGLFILMLVLVAVLPYVWPMQDYAAKIEKQLSTQLRQPVHIGHLKAALLPLPKLELQDVSVGSAPELKAGNVALNFGFSALFSEVKAINKMEIDGLTLGADSFDKALGWLQAAGGDTHYPVAHMVLRHANISGEGLNLPSVNGSADLDAQGHFAKIVLSSEDGKLGMELKPQQSRWQIALNLKESRLPFLPGIPFNELSAKGEVSEASANFNEIDGRLYGGALTGNASLTWQKGWQMQGHITVKAMELQNALPQLGVTGEVEGDSSFTMSGAKLPQLSNALNLDGSFVARKGVINNIDMVETASSGSRSGAAGGRTHFDELSGLLQADSSGQHLRQIKISAGVMSANGSVDVSPGGQLSGRLNVDLKMRAGLGSVPLSLSGQVGKPALHVAR